MKAVILAGGYGTRISEESHLKPKPMIEIGEKPILWHILKTYSSYDINEFVICCGYKGEQIKEYFTNFNSETWDIELVDTGLDTMTGGRLKRIQSHIDDTFCVTYGDGLCNIDINNLISFHREKKSIATLTAVHPPEGFGVLSFISQNILFIFNFLISFFICLMHSLEVLLLEVIIMEPLLLVSLQIYLNNKNVFDKYIIYMIYI